MAITAPFQFARIPRAVWFPEWGDLVSHDVPFIDGYSGTIDIEIEAMTPLLIGGPRRKATETKAGEVWPVRLPDGTYAIPGSSLQGMIRNILEIACFGKLGPWVEQRRFGIRDLTSAAKPYFQDRMLEIVSGNHGNPKQITPNVRTGWLRKEGNRFFLRTCKMARVEYSLLAPLGTADLADPPKLKPKENYQSLDQFVTAKTAHDASQTWRKKSDVRERYEWLRSCNVWFSAGLESFHHHRRNEDQHRQLNIKYVLASDCSTSVRPGLAEGQLVITGSPSDPPNNPNSAHKHMEFIFYGSNSEIPLSSSFEDRFGEFLAIHQPDDGRPTNPNWEFYRDNGHPSYKPFEQGGWMPIFYLENLAGEPKSFGLAFMFKLAHELDTHQMLENSSASHLNKTDYDLASLIFGGTGSENEGWHVRSLKRRASFEWAEEKLPVGQALPVQSINTVLLAPKPSYFPIYVRQPASINCRTDLYATYTRVSRHGDNIIDAESRNMPELSGAKIWPVRSDGDCQILPSVPDEIRNNLKIQNQLNALPAGTIFKCKLHFQNLRHFELGALLWALTFGDENVLRGVKPSLRHRIGMAKSGNFGSLAIRLLESQTPLKINDPDRKKSKLSEILSDFMERMNKVCTGLAEEGRTWSAKQPKWIETTQYKALIQQANPNGIGNGLGNYMPLGDRNNPNSYVGARTGDFLPPWSDDGLELKRSALAAQKRRQQQSPRHLKEVFPTTGYPFVEDAPIIRKSDHAGGFLREQAHGGAWLASFNGGTPELIYPEDVDVIGAPDI